MNTTPIYLNADFYKLSHREQYPKGTTTVYSTLTPRSNKFAPWADRVVFFGLQYFVKEYLINRFNTEFFNVAWEDIEETYTSFLENTLGKKPETSHLKELHSLGYLPLEIKSVSEGTRVGMRTPCVTIENTLPQFFWLTNFIETILSTTIWQPTTSATLAYEYKKILDKYAKKTEDNSEYTKFQGHDFSMRGMSSEQTAMTSGMGHLTSFVGSDTIPAIFGANKYYSANLDYSTGTSIPATEHSVMCSYGETNELELFEHLITNVYPSGLFSVVSDTWDFWNVVGEYLPKLKDKILSRDGKVVIRPDSGDPVKIIIGDSESSDKLAHKGLIECLWDIFGGTVNAKGYKILNSKIGAIYGDSITLERAEAILEGLEKKGFAASNIVFGIGSFSYQYHTRDTFGLAVKATYAIVDGEERLLFKDPKTDDGTKRSQRGRVSVKVENNETVSWKDGLLKGQDTDSDLETIFLNGELVRHQTLEEIRNTLKG